MTSAAYHSGTWYLARGDELRRIGDHADLAGELADRRVRVECRDHHALIELAAFLADRAAKHGAPLPGVAVRGGVNGLEFCGVSWGRARVHTGRTMLSDKDGQKGAGPIPPGPERALWSERLGDLWRDAVRSLGLRVRASSGSTAAQILPDMWVRASKKLAQTEPWQDIRRAYYGGRVQLYQTYEGEAVEHDLNTAYGAGLAGHWGYLPDCALYPNREPWCNQPAWADVTVEVQSDVAPLPYRVPERTWQVQWPRVGRWRAWYPWHELDAPGVTVCDIHRCHSGRWDYALEDRASALLARCSDGPFVRAVIKQLLVSLAGKLAQKPIAWAVWSGDESAPLPDVLHHFGTDSGLSLDLYPLSPRYYPPTYLPQVASYLTSKVRVELRREIARAGSQAIYVDTDSIHTAGANGYCPLDSGPKPGQWSVKARGPARYIARRYYFVGSKRVNC